MTFNFAYPNGSPEERGWGPGWEPGLSIGSRPASFPGELLPLAVDDVFFVGGIREELYDLAYLLITESLRRGYIPRLDDPGCWGGAFRPTKNSDGSYTNTPSNHSWYTALDINAPRNVYGGTVHQIPAVMADLWREYGWRWLGPPIADWMHFDFAGSPDDADRMTSKAFRAFGMEDPLFTEWKEGWDAHDAGTPKNPDWPATKREGWDDRRAVLSEARDAARSLVATISVVGDGTVPEHDHQGTVTFTVS